MSNKDASDSTARADFLAEHGPLGEALLEKTGGNLESARRFMAEDYQGAYADGQAFARSYVQARTDMPHDLIHYIDCDRLARDLFAGDFFSIDLGNCHHVFRGD